jgi:hypothetical protein
MSILVLKTYDDNPIANGKMIKLVEDSGFSPGERWLAKEFDEKVDSLNLVIGVVYTKTNSGRITANPDGFCFNDFDYFTYNEDLSPDYNTANTNFNPSFNPAADDSYVYVATCGMVAVENAYSSYPSTWKKLRTGTTYDLYCII